LFTNSISKAKKRVLDGVRSIWSYFQLAFKKKTTWPRTLQCARRVGWLFSVMRGEQSGNVK
jgi:hypothetical protein